jgi:antitoxin Phd
VRTWQVQEAKSKFSEVVKRAAKEGPQIITHHGAEAAVVLSIDEFRRLEAGKPSVVDFLLGGSKLSDADAELLADRARDTGRETEL